MRNVISKRKNGSRRMLQFCDDASMTKQCFRDECDVNIVLRKYQKTGKLPPVQEKPALYGDFSGVLEYRDSLDLVARAKEQFMALDSSLRNRFANDPVLFLAFCSDPANLVEMYSLGLAVRPVAPVEPVVDSVVDPVVVKNSENSEKKDAV